MESYLTTLDPAASFPIEYFHVSGSIFPLFDFPLLGGTAKYAPPRHLRCIIECTSRY